MGTTIIDKFITKAEFYGMTSIIREVQMLIQIYRELIATQTLLTSTSQWTNLLTFLRTYKAEIIAVAGVLGALLGVGIAMAALKTRQEFEGLQLQMNAIFQSADKGKQAFNWAVNYANRTPFDVKEVIEGFKTLASLNIQPTEKIMNTLGAMSKLSAGGNRTVGDAALAVNAAANGQWQRLLRGFTMSKDQVNSITGKNIDTLKTHDEKVALILDAMDKKAPGLIASFSDSLSNAQTNMVGAWEVLLNTVGKLLEPLAIFLLDNLTKMLTAFIVIGSLLNIVTLFIGQFISVFSFVKDNIFAMFHSDREDRNKQLSADYQKYIEKSMSDISDNWAVATGRGGDKGIPNIHKYGYQGLNDQNKLIQQVVGKGDIAQIGVKLTEFGKSGSVHRPLTIKIDSKDGSPLSKAMADIAIKTIKDAVAQKKLNLEFN